MGRVKDVWMDWQEQAATPEQLELPLDKQLQLASDWYLRGSK